MPVDKVQHHSTVNDAFVDDMGLEEDDGGSRVVAENCVPVDEVKNSSTARSHQIRATQSCSGDMDVGMAGISDA